MISKQELKNNSLYLFGEVLSEYLQGASFMQGSSIVPFPEKASLNLDEKGYQEGGEVSLSLNPEAITPVRVVSEGPGVGDMGGQPGFTADGNVDAGVNTVAGTVAGIVGLVAELSNASPSIAFGKGITSLVTGVPPTPNVAPISQQFAAIQNFFETEAEANAVLGGLQAAIDAGRGTEDPFGFQITSSNPRGREAQLEDEEAAAQQAAANEALGAQNPTTDLTGEEDDTPGRGRTDAQIADEIEAAQNAVAAEGLVDSTEGPTGGDTSGIGGSTDTGQGADAEAASGPTSAAEASGNGDSDGGDGGDSGEADGIGIAKGGYVKGYQEGDLVEDDQADTQLDSLGLGPIGIVDDPDGTTGVADDLEMELPDKSYVLNAEATNASGKVSINKMIKEAIDMAIADGVDLPSEIKTAEKVPIRISKGETAIPHPLGEYIGLSKLEKMNNRGLRAREQRQGQQAPVQMAAAPTAQEDLLAQVQQPVV